MNTSLTLSQLGCLTLGTSQCPLRIHSWDKDSNTELCRISSVSEWVTELQAFEWLATCCGAVCSAMKFTLSCHRSHLCPEQRWWKVCLSRQNRCRAYLEPGSQNRAVALESCVVGGGLEGGVHFGNWVCGVCSQCVTLACPPQSSLTCPRLTLPQSNQNIVSNPICAVTGRHLIWHFTEM